MKTTKCSKCGAEIPLNYIVCPHCKERCRSTRVRQTAMLFAFCLGFVGVHNFYMGYYAKGIAEVCVFTLSLVFLIVGGIKSANFLIVLGIIVLACCFAYAITEGIFLKQKKWSRDKFGKKLLEKPRHQSPISSKKVI